MALKRVAGGQRAVFERRLFGLCLCADQLGDVGDAAGRQRARAFPQGCTVAAGLVLAGRIAEVTQRAPVHVTSVEHRLQGKIAVFIHLDGDFLADEAWFVAAAEDEHFDPRLAAARLEFEAAHQFTSREIVGLIDDGDGVGRIRQPHATELDVAGDRVRRDRDRLDPSLRMFPEYPLISVSPAASGISRTRRPITPLAT